MVPHMAAQVEGQANAAQASDLVCPCDVLVLAAVPAVHQKHTRHHGVRAYQCAVDVLAIDRDVDGVSPGRHQGEPRCTL